MSRKETILVIPDAHATPGVDNERFTWLGNYIVCHQPDLIVCIGDLAHMGSLSLFDVGTKRAEGQSVQADINVTIEANEMLWAPVRAYNRTQLRAGQPVYSPKKVMTLGNHEERINRAANKDPKMFGFLTMEDLQYEKFGWEVMPFLEPYVYHNHVFQHYFTAGLRDMSIGGLNAARRLANIDGRTRIMGHSHVLQYHREGRGKVRYGLVAGCYFEHEEHYLSREAQMDWWRGVILIKDVETDPTSPHYGESNPYFIPMSVVKDFR